MAINNHFSLYDGSSML